MDCINKETPPSGISRERFIQIPCGLLLDVISGKLEPRDFVVYAAMRNRLGANSYVWPSEKTIAQESGCGDRTVRRSLQRLEAANHISRNGRTKYGTNKIFFKTKIGKGGIVVEEEPSSLPDGLQSESETENPLVGDDIPF